MARYRESYSLYSRETVNGKTVFYYRTYTPDGKRTSGKSTGCVNKSAARQYCENLLKAGKLYDGSSKRFSDFAEGFFDDGGIWHFEKTGLQKGIKQISKSYVVNQRGLFNKHILPYFSDTKLETINTAIIKKFRIDLAQKELSIKTINLICACLKTVINAALESNLIMTDPFRTVKPLYEEKHKRDAYTLQELQLLFGQEWINKNVWLFILTAALTGMRRSEILAIRKETLNEKYIDIKDQFLRGSYQLLKNKYARKVPIPKELFYLLNQSLVDDIVFNYSAGFYTKKLEKMLPLISDWKDRKLCMHSFRHFFNTFLLAENISSTKVSAVIGHSSGQNSMQELYTSWKPELMPEVYEAQEKLFNLLFIK